MTSKPLRVVLADDTEDIRFLLRTCLSGDPRFEVVGEAANGAEAVEVAASMQPDAIVLDLAMPVMDGLQAAPEIRERAPACKILVLSGFAASRMSERAHEAGAHHYVEKGAAMTSIAGELAGMCGLTETAVAPSQPAARANDGLLDALVSEREESARLREADDVKSALLAAVSHDLRNPLTAIQGFGETLERDESRLDTALRHELIAGINRNAARMNRTIQNLTDHDRVARGAVRPTIEPVVVDASVPRLVEALDPPSRARISVTVEPARARADAGLLERAVENLIANSLRHAGPDARVWVTVGRRQDRVEITVADDGPGIPIAQRRSMYEPFRRGQATGGSGMGLYIVSRFIDLMAGSVSYEERPGGGSCFRIALPAA